MTVFGRALEPFGGMPDVGRDTRPRCIEATGEELGLDVAPLGSFLVPDGRFPQIRLGTCAV